MLKAALETEAFEKLDDLLKAEYSKKDDKYVLQVTKVGGLALEDVGGLKTTLEKLRKSERTLTKEVETSRDALQKHRELFEGIDPATAKDALSKIDDIQNWDGETKVKEAVKVALEEADGKSKARIEEVQKQHDEKVTKLNDDLAASHNQLQGAVVTSKIIEAISKEQGNVDLLMPHVKSKVKMVRDGNGVWKAEILNANGDPRFSDADASKDMTIAELVVEMKEDTTFAAAFPGANSTGSGKNKSSDNKNIQNTDKGPKVIPDTKEATSKHIAEIANGTVVVEGDSDGEGGTYKL